MPKKQLFIKDVLVLEYIKSIKNNGSKSNDIEHYFKFFNICSNKTYFFRKKIDWKNRINWYYGFVNENDCKISVDLSFYDKLNTLSNQFM